MHAFSGDREKRHFRRRADMEEATAAAPAGEDKAVPARKTAPLMNLLGRVQAAGSTALQATRTAGSTAMNNGFVLDELVVTLRHMLALP